MSAGVSQNRSIWDIIQSLKTSFRDADFSAAVSELMAREEGLKKEKGDIVSCLREKCNSLEAEFGDLKMKELLWEEECRQLRRDLDVTDDKLSLSKEKEEKANERCNSLLGDLRAVEDKNVKLIGEMSQLTCKVDQVKGVLLEKEIEIEDYVSKEARIMAELEEVRRKNMQLEEEKLKHDALLEELKNEKDEKIEGLLKKNETAKKLLEAELNAKREELGDIRRNNEILKEEKAKFEDKVEDLRRDNLEKDEQIRKLVGKNNEMLQEKKLVEKRFLKLEEDVITCMGLNLERDKRFASAPIGKILSGVIQALDSQEKALTCNAGVEKYGTAKEADSTSFSRVKEPNCSSKLDKQSAEGVKRTLDFNSEIVREDGATGSKNDIVVIESDDEDENPLPVNAVNRKRKRFGTKHISDASNDDSLNPRHKLKRVTQVPYEPVKLGSSPQGQTRPTIISCENKGRREFSGPSVLSGDSYRKGDDSAGRGGTPKSAGLLSPQLQDYVKSLRQKKQAKRVVCLADMYCDFAQDNEYCAKAICALYRRLKSQSSTGSDVGGSTGFEECDRERVFTLAEFLIDGDPRGNLKKSVIELQAHDQKGLNDCKRIAKKYQNIVFDIYKKREDPLFSPSSDLQYK